MANSYFRFKEFTIHQDKCAMKVCTDACLLGAWAAEKVSHLIPRISTVLDIGTGTGLLALMIAQKNAVRVDAIEINKEAAMQAADNFRESPYKDQISVIHISVQDFLLVKKYELIICNPPFYENNLKSPDPDKNAAKHESTLTIEVLFSLLKNLLTANGSAIIMVPYERRSEVEAVAVKYQMLVADRLLIRQTPSHPFFRLVLRLSFDPAVKLTSGELSIHDIERNYSMEFVSLLKDFYLMEKK